MHDISQLSDAIAHLSEQIDEMRIEQTQHNRSAEEVLKQWSQTNLHLTDCLTAQAEDLSGSNLMQQELAKHLIVLAQHSGELGVSTQELKNSLESLTQYLQEAQSPQILQLAENTAQLKDSSTSLVSFLKGEQAQRLKLLENGLKSLIEIYDVQKVHPQTSVTRTGNPVEMTSPRFDFLQGLSLVGAFSVMTCGLSLLLWYSGGIGNALTRIDERSNWTMIKLERIESFLGIKSVTPD